MKGDIAVDVRCPLEGCPWTGHPRLSIIETGHHEYTPTPRTMVKKSVFQHLIAAHPELDIRDRSLLSAAAADAALELVVLR